MEEILEYVPKLSIDSDLLTKCNINTLNADEIKLLKELKDDWKIQLKISIEYEILYDKLYIGPYYKVPECYKKMFLLLSFFKAVADLRTKESKDFAEAIKILDVALMVGANLKEAELITEFTQKVHDFVVKLHPFISLEPFTDLQLETSQNQCDIASVSQPSIEHFITKYFNFHQPVVITDAMDQWKALKKWKDLNYLLQMCGHRTVPIELGKCYDDDNWGQNLFRFSDFVTQHMLSEEHTERGYLAQHDLFDQIPILKDGFVVPEYCAIGNDEPVIKSWIGPKNTISTMHTDDKHNFLCQVVGEKLIILAHPRDSEYLYPYDGLLSNTSQVDAEHIDHEKFPAAKNVKFQRIILKAGQMLYIPKLHWHYVRSLTPSISISFWFNCD